jgi:hypothetical protein
MSMPVDRNVATKACAVSASFSAIRPGYQSWFRRRLTVLPATTQHFCARCQAVLGMYA